MTLPTYSTAFTDNVSTISADFLNAYVRTQIPKALDGVAGGSYTPSATLSIQGQGVEFVVKTGKTVSLESGSTFTNAATQTRSGGEALSGASATTAWRTVDGAAGDTTYDVTYDEVRVPATASGAPTIYTLRDATAPVPVAGNRIRFSRNAAALTNGVRFLRETGATILVTMNATSGSFVEFCFATAPTDATARWRLVAWGGDLTVAAVL